MGSNEELMGKKDSYTHNFDSSDLCVAVAMHKPYRVPEDSMYMPLQVGKALHPDLDLGIQTDDIGDNISSLNSSYSELTALYWIWKNNSAEYKGLVHYRRHFASCSRKKSKDDVFDQIVKHDEVDTLLQSVDIILPKKRKYYIETMYSHYAHTLPVEHLDVTRKIIRERVPEYLPAFDKVMKNRSGHMFNMFIMQKDKFNEYCEWLFPILDELTKRIDSTGYNAFDARYPGRVSELLLDVWIITKQYSYVELPVVSTELVDWLKKGTSFLLAKFLGKKYSKSF